MDGQFDFVSILKANLLPAVLGVAGLLLVSVGLVALLSKNENSNTLEFEASTNSPKASNSGSITSKIIVDIQGGVIKPGIYSLPQGSRVHDLLVASGGLSDSADRDWAAKNVNLAMKLNDGQKLYIHRVGEEILDGASTTSLTTSEGTSLIDINSASLSELDMLPGIGRVTAQKIVDQRPFATISDLLSKKTVSSSVFEKIKDKITAN